MGRLKVPTQLSNYRWCFHIFFEISIHYLGYLGFHDPICPILWFNWVFFQPTNQLRTGCSNKAQTSAPWTKMVTPLTAWRAAAAAHKWRRCSSATRHRLQGLEASRGFTFRPKANQRLLGGGFKYSLFSSLLGEDYPI